MYCCKKTRVDAAVQDLLENLRLPCSESQTAIENSEELTEVEQTV